MRVAPQGASSAKKCCALNVICSLPAYRPGSPSVTARARLQPSRLQRRRAPILGAALLGAAALALASAACAAASASAASGTATMFAAPAHQGLPGPAGGLARVTLALLVVLAAVFAAAWFSRRMHGAGGTRSSSLEVIAQLPLGPRERAVLIRVGAHQVLVGVANGSVRALHVLAQAELPAATGVAPTAPAAPGNEPGQRPTFKALLLRSLGK